MLTRPPPAPQGCPPQPPAAPALRDRLTRARRHPPRPGPFSFYFVYFQPAAALSRLSLPPQTGGTVRSAPPETGSAADSHGRGAALQRPRAPKLKRRLVAVGAVCEERGRAGCWGLFPVISSPEILIISLYFPWSEVRSRLRGKKFPLFPFPQPCSPPVSVGVQLCLTQNAIFYFLFF